MKKTEIRESYDIIAQNYAEQFRNEMDKKPFDRKMLEWLREKVGDRGIICDLGCGPGQIAGYLHSCGAEVCGIDLSSEMVRQAKILHPEIPFQTGDMTNLKNVTDESFGGIAAFYSIVNIPPEMIEKVFHEMHRVLRPSAFLLLSFHIGNETVHLEEMLDRKVSLNFFFYESQKIVKQLKASNFTIEEIIEREPYAEEIEHQSRRAYIFARK